ncbi:hypothetical protein KR009_011862 [Drosophila setifemur]|nr:hypothetical protein KR009_011862 [Drosophila setifemur]
MSPVKSIAVPRPRTPTDSEVLSIYKDVSKLANIERHLNLLYRPFTCFVNTKSRYNLVEMEQLISHSRYDPQRHMALFVNRLMPVSSLKIYANGNIYCQGYSRKSARRGLENFVELLRSMGYHPSLHLLKFNVVNATFCMPFHVDLGQLHQQHNTYTIYNPKRQPFLTYRMPHNLIKFAIFPMGYVYVMFAAMPGHTKEAIAHILPVLSRFKAPPRQDLGDITMSCGDIDFKVLWEKEFQRENDFSIEW